jgi:ADP-heptose:LPS heptosyltransferase/O-antigen ligase
MALAANRVAGWALPGFALFAVASIALQNLVFVALAAWCFGMAWRRKWVVRATPLNFPLLLLGLTLLASSLLAGYLNPSLYGLRKVGLMAIFFLTVSLAEQPLTADRYLNLYVIGAAVCAVWSVFSFHMGWSGTRARSFSGDYMAAGGMYMLGLILATARTLYRRGAARWRWGAAVIVLAWALALTFTRSSWLGAAAALILLLGVKDWRLLLAAAAVVASGLIFFPHNPVTERVATISVQSPITSNTERRMMWDTAVKLIRDQPWLGYGIDNLSRYYGRYVHREAIEQNPPHVHNTEMQLALNGGLTALVFFLWWAAAVLWLGFAGYRRNVSAAPARAGSILGLTAAFVGFLVNGLFEFNFGTSQVITIVYFLAGLLPVLALADPKQPDWVLPKRPRFLFLRPRFRGDVLLASAVPRLVKRDFPGARVDLLTEPDNALVAQGEPEWDEIITLPRRGLAAWRQGVRRIRAENYDVVCDLFGNPRTAQLTLASGGRLKIGPQVTGWGFVYHLRTQADRPGPRPAWEAYYDVLRALGMKHFTFQPRWVLTSADETWIRNFLAERRAKPRRLLGIFPGASHPAKRWRLERFIETAKQAARQFGLKSVFVFGPQEKDLHKEFDLSAGSYFLSALNLTPRQLAALWSQCAAVISNDAFPLHLGPAVGTPTVGLFGPGEPEVWFPYSPRLGHRFIHVAPDCWPCHKDVCPDNICWRELTPDRVLSVLAEIVGKRKPGPAGRGRRVRRA